MRTGARALLALATVALSVSAAGAQAAIPQGNALLNGDGETGSAVGDESSHICPQGWTCDPTFPNTTLVRYGTTLFPSVAESARIGGGNNFFAGGPSNSLSGATQRVDLGEQPEFTAGTVKATFSGCLGGFQSQGDAPILQITFFTRDDPDTGMTTSRKGPTAAQRGNQTTLLAVSQTVAVPPQTHAFRFTLSFLREGDGYNDGYADNLSVTFGPASGPDPAGASCSVPAGGGEGGGGGGAGTGGGEGGSGTGAGGGGSNGAKDPLKLLSFGPAVIGYDGKAQVRITCNSKQLARCKGTLWASLQGFPQGKRKPPATSFSIPSLKSRTLKIALRGPDLRKIRSLSKRALAGRRLSVRATTVLGSLRFKQTSAVKLSRRA